MSHAIVSALITDELHVARWRFTNDGPYPRDHRRAFNDGSRRKNEDPSGMGGRTLHGTSRQTAPHAALQLFRHSPEHITPCSW